MKRISYVVLCTILMGIVGAHADPPSQTSPAQTTPGSFECNPAFARFVPGEFNFCLALRAEEKGRYREMVSMLKLAASWGQKRAQFNLGVLYFNGRHVPVDHARGLAWLALASERRDTGYLNVFSSAYSRSTPAERQRADALLRALEPQYADKYAMRRADRRFKRQVAELKQYEPYASTVCVAGIGVGPNGAGWQGDPRHDGTGFDQGMSVTNTCPTLPMAMHMINAIGDDFFGGWNAHVDVGPIMPSQGPAAASTVGR
jgi:hypothetical protein